MTIRQAVAQGATKQEIAETIGMMGLFGGLPAMNKAMELAGEVLEEKK
jgi:4-carboxymuconolactone decarboxylase